MGGRGKLGGGKEGHILTLQSNNIKMDPLNSFAL